ncbi:MAG: exosortase J [Terracidiphilus sp.]
MSTLSFPAALSIQGQRTRRTGLRTVALAAAILAISIAALLPVELAALHVWKHDPLRSIGVFFPLAAVVLALRAWRQMGWGLFGSWWSVLPLAIAATLLQVRERFDVQLLIGRQVWIIPNGVVLSLFASAVLLAIGGFALLRRCLLPLFLLLMVNPVPPRFNQWLDLPLQRVSADVARSFAALIQEHPDGAELRLMFAPDFGMFIAPGCDGIRGAVTLGYLGIFAALWNRCSALKVVCAGALGVLTGYIFNLVRLCVLVVYYKAGRWFPSIKPYGTQVDYAIGATLFLLVCIAMCSLLQRKHEATVSPAKPSSNAATTWGPVLLLAAVSTVLAVPQVLAVERHVQQFGWTAKTNNQPPHLPQKIGAFRLVSEWEETYNDGTPFYRWGRYTDGDPSRDLQVGLYMQQGGHLPLWCHLARGEQVTEGEPVLHYERDGSLTTYGTFAYNDGISDVFEAFTICERCGTNSGTRQISPLRVVSLAQTSVVIKTEALQKERVPQPQMRQRVTDFLTVFDAQSLVPRQ